MPTQRELAFEASAAARVMRREVGEIEKIARRAGADLDRFLTFAREFYEQHTAHVAELMVLDEQEAREYVYQRVTSLPAKAEEIGAWIARLARAGAADLIEIRGYRVRAVLEDRKRRGGKHGGR